MTYISHLPSHVRPLTPSIALELQQQVKQQELEQRIAQLQTMARELELQEQLEAAHRAKRQPSAEQQRREAEAAEQRRLQEAAAAVEQRLAQNRKTWYGLMAKAKASNEYCIWLQQAALEAHDELLAADAMQEVANG